MATGTNTSDLLKSAEELISVYLAKHPNLRTIAKRLESGRGSYSDAFMIARVLGNILKETYTTILATDAELTMEIAEELIRPTLEGRYKTIAQASQLAQQAVNKSAGVNLKATKAELNQSRVDGIIVKAVADSVKDHDEMIRTLGSNAENFCMSVVDDTVRTNADAWFTAGLSPVIIRKADGPKACKWCQALVGAYEYPVTNNDVYRRHKNCYCSVTMSKDGGRTSQSVWDNKKFKANEQERRRHIEIGKRMEARIERDRKESAERRALNR